MVFEEEEEEDEDDVAGCVFLERDRFGGGAGGERGVALAESWDGS